VATNSLNPLPLIVGIETVTVSNYF